MLRRRFRENAERREIRLGPLRLDVSDHDALDGTLRTCENMRPAGPVDAWYLTPVAPRTDVLEFAGETVVAIGKYATDTEEEIIAVTDANIYSLDSDWNKTVIHTFSSADSTRKAQFATVGLLLFIALSSGTGCGEPEDLMVYNGSECRSHEIPQLPDIEVTNTEVTANGLNENANYSYRFAYVFKDGTVGPPGRPQFFFTDALASGGTGFKVDWQIARYPDSTNPADDSYWADEITGIAIYLTQEITEPPDHDDVEWLFSVPYYRVATIKKPSEVTLGNDVAEYTGTDDEVASFTTLEDDNLLQHKISAAACHSYNSQLLLGDVAYDFRKPNALLNFAHDTASILPSRQFSSDYGIRLGVTIKTNKGEFQRISDPVFIASSGTGDLEFRGFKILSSGANSGNVLAYPDRRVTEFQLYVDDDNDGVYQLHSTFDAKPSTIHNVSFFHSTGSYDLTTGLTTDMPTADAIDRDPNRMLRSETFASYEFPASRALYTTRDDSDILLGFAANERAASEGQFGFAPIIAIGKQSIRAYEADSDGDLTRAVVVSTDRGALGRYAFTNANGLIVFAAQDGIWTLSPQISSEPMSNPVHGHGALSDILAELDEDTALAFVDDGRGNREIWTGTSSQSWIFSFDYGMWFTADRARFVFFRDGKNLYSFRAATNFLTEELQADPGRVDWSLKTTPLTLGWPGDVKRLYRLAIRQRSDQDFPGGLDQIEYVVFDTIDEDNLGGEEGYVAESADTIDAFQRLVAIGTLTVADADTLSLDDNATGYVIDKDEGALVAAGIMQRTITSDVASLHAGIMRDAYVILRGPGKMGQGIESLDFDFEPRLTHRARRRNY